MLSAIQLQMQRDILMSFYRATAGNRWRRKDNWDDSSKPVSSFYGVTVDKISGAVIELSLFTNELTGTF